MDKIEVALHAHFAEAAANSDSTLALGAASSSTTSAGSSDASTAPAPFARVNSVVPNSPAATAGLLTGDRIVRFGTADWLNHDRLVKVSEIVSSSVGVRIMTEFLIGIAR